MFKKKGLIATYLKLKEAGSVSDFPHVMADVQHKILIEAFRGFPTAYEKYCLLGDLNDFKAHHRKWLGEADDLKPVGNGKPYKATKFADYGYSIQLGTFGETFSLLRETVINDDLNAFKKVPAALGRAAKRTLAKQVCAHLESNGAAYDGNALFGTRNSLANHSSGVLSADATGIASVQAGILAIATSKDPGNGEIMGLSAKRLVCSPSKAEAAKWILTATEIGRGSTDAPTSNPLLSSALAANLEKEPVVDPFLTAFPNRWYLFADPEQAPALEVGFLNNQREPEVFMKDSAAIRMAGGGKDDFGYDYDNIEYKIRWDWGTAAAMYQAVYKGGD